MPHEVARRTVAIGDIHGCIHALECLLEAIDPRSDDQIIVLGDFIDQGHESRMVIDCLISLEKQCELICLLGNHEEMLLAAAETGESAQRFWENCGGVQTLNSYRFGGGLQDIPDEHWEFIHRCADYLETDEHIFVHANLDPDLALFEQERRTLRWELLDPETARAHASKKPVVVGHTEQISGEVLDLGCFTCIDTACWRYGWLTGLDVTTGQIWQSSRFGQLRQRDEAPVGPIVAPSASA